MTNNPFGQSISVEDILDSLSFFDSWEERYKYIIDLGKELPAMDESKKNPRKYCSWGPKHGMYS
jgi:cysteine desulfuration protein SufE